MLLSVFVVKLMYCLDHRISVDIVYVFSTVQYSVCACVRPCVRACVRACVTERISENVYSLIYSFYTSGKTDVLAFRSVGLSQDGFIGNINLAITDPATNLPVYYITVKSFNRANIGSTVMSSR